jgi:hypothetical protein
VPASSDGRRARAIPHRVGEKWSVEMQLEEPGGRTYDVFLNRTFITQMAADEAGAQVASEWLDGVVAARDLMLQELAAAYRRLRTMHRTMRPVSVPTTRSAWEEAFDVWEGLGWIGAPDASRYREHVRCAFETVAQNIRRHRLESDPSA